jgi:membrane protease YdiL (CAAX protease family)
MQSDLSPQQQALELPSPASALRWLMLVFELGLMPVAWLLGWLLGLWSWQQVFLLPLPAECLPLLGLGLLATLPMLLLLLLVMQSTWSAVIRLREVVDQFVRTTLSNASIWMLAALSLAAGLGEEWLFRGLLQAGLADWWGEASAPQAILVAAVIFGLCHWLTHLYFLAAFLIGIYLGWLYWWTESLVVPIVAHALYDLIGLLVITRAGRSETPAAS